MPSPEREAAEALLRAAKEDETAIRELLDSERIVDAVIGFHAQQAIEKQLKAVLASRGVDYPFTHDLARLLDEIGRESLPDLPVQGAEDLTPWATELRYGTVPAGRLDRGMALAAVESFRTWAEREVGSATD